MKTWRALFLPMVLLSACSIAVPPREAFESDAAEPTVDADATADGQTETPDTAELDGSGKNETSDTAEVPDTDKNETSDTPVADAPDKTDISDTAVGDAPDQDETSDAAEVADADKSETSDSADLDAPAEIDTADAVLDVADADLCGNVSCPDLACATQKCDAATGKCVATAKVDGWPCDDGKKCTADDACLSGVCTGGAKNCDDGNACTNDSCNASLGCVNTVVTAGTTCDDGDACTMADGCVGTSCVGTESLWAKTFGTNGSLFTGVAPTADGGWVATGGWVNGAAVAGERDFWLVKVNVAGKQEWTHTYGTGAGTGMGRAVLATADGYLVAGEKALNINEDAAWLIKTDTSGVLQWQKTWGTANQASARALVADSDGVIVVGRMPATSQKDNPWVARVDGKGQESWSAQPVFGGFSGQFFGASAAPQGFVAVGTLNDNTADDGVLARFDSSGNLLWHRQYGGTGYDAAYAVVPFGDGWAVAGERNAALPGISEQMWLFTTDANGQLQWQRTFGSGMLNPGLAIATLDDGIVVAGEYVDSANIPTAAVIRTDHYGSLLWSKTIPNTSSVASFLVGDSLVLAGQSRGPIVSPRYGWLARTDLWGNATCTDSGACAGFTSDCDDGNACTADLCAKGACSHVNLADTAPCGSGDACKVGETCTAGSCGGGGAKLFDQAVVGIASVTGAAALAVGSGGFTISATTKGGSNGVPRLVHTDAAGVVTWDKTYALGSYAGQVAALIGTGEGYALAGSVASDNNAENPFLIVTDGGGVAKVNVELGTSADEWIAGLAQTGDGYLLAGKSGAAPGAHELLLIHTDALGAQLWQKTYGGAGLHAATAVVALADGAILAGWSQAPGDTPEAWLLRTDAAGGQVWSVLLGATVADGHNALAVVNDGFVITGNTPGSGDLTLTRTDSTGTVLWSRGYPGLTTARAIVARNDGFIVTGGALSGYQLRTDNDGNVLWQQTSSAVNDGGVALADGFAFSAATSGGLHLTRTDLWGNASCAASGTCAGLSLYDCDDSNPCTADLCDATHSGCWHANMADGLACGYGATCGAGVCKCEPGYLSVTTGEGKVCAADVPVWGNLPYSPANMTDNGNGTVTDGGTGLTWQQADPGGLSYSWSAANQFCIDQKLAGYSDWRLPTLAELNTLIDFNKVNPATPNLLQTNVNLPYWSATPLANAANNAWSVSFVIGTQQAGQLTSNNHVRCVRGTTATPPTPRFTAANGIVTDAWTGLMWQQDFSPSISAAASTTYCGALLVNGVTMWRIPNVVELRTLIDRSVSGPAIDSALFPATPSEWFWASSGAGGSSADFWSVYFSEGLSEGNGKANTFRVRCVK